MKANLKSTLCGGAFAFALLGGAALTAAPASANPVHVEGHASAGSNVIQVRHRIFGPPAYAYDPDFDGPAYYGPPIDYGPPVEYAPPVAYDYGPPDYDDYGPGPGVALVAPGPSVEIGY